VDVNAGKFVHEMFTPTQSAITQSMNSDKDGNIWLGNLNGVFVYDENNFESAIASETHIRAIKQIKDEKSYSGPALSYLPKFQFNQNDIEILFYSYHLMEDNQHNYQYRLVGLEDNWSELTANSSARFTNLDPGNYRFEVRSINMDGAQSKVETLSFGILSPWYETAWYYSAQAGFFLLLIIVTYFFSRGSESQFSEILILITVITLFEFIILALEPQVEQYANGVPLFKLAMNIVLALSLHPMERLLRKLFKRNSTS